MSRNNKIALLCSISLIASQPAFAENGGIANNRAYNPISFGHVDYAAADNSGQPIQQRAQLGQSILGSILGGGNNNNGNTGNGPSLGTILGAIIAVVIVTLIIKSAKDAAAKKSCVNKDDADALVKGQIYSDGTEQKRSTRSGVVCNSVKLKGVKDKQVETVANQMATNMQDKSQKSGKFTMLDDKGNQTAVDYTASDTFEKDVAVDVRLVDGIEAPPAGSEVRTTEFYRANVRKTLTLRSAPRITDDSTVTGGFRAGQIVRVVSFTPDGQWALLSANGLGIGYVNAGYLAPAQGVSDVDVALPMTPAALAIAERPAPAVAKGKKPGRRTPAPAPVQQTAQPVQQAPSGPAKVKFVKVTHKVPCRRYQFGSRTSDTNEACNVGGGAVAFNTQTAR